MERVQWSNSLSIEKDRLRAITNEVILQVGIEPPRGLCPHYHHLVRKETELQTKMPLVDALLTRTRERSRQRSTNGQHEKKVTKRQKQKWHSSQDSALSQTLTATTVVMADAAMVEAVCNGIRQWYPVGGGGLVFDTMQLLKAAGNIVLPLPS
jgi:hypothetical protein